jgi:hypothetical protein
MGYRTLREVAVTTTPKVTKRAKYVEVFFHVGMNTKAFGNWTTEFSQISVLAPTMEKALNYKKIFSKGSVFAEISGPECRRYTTKEGKTVQDKEQVDPPIRGYWSDLNIVFPNILYCQRAVEQHKKKKQQKSLEEEQANTPITQEDRINAEPPPGEDDHLFD